MDLWIYAWLVIGAYKRDPSSFSASTLLLCFSQHYAYNLSWRTSYRMASAACIEILECCALDSHACMKQIFQFSSPLPLHPPPYPLRRCAHPPDHALTDSRRPQQDRHADGRYGASAGQAVLTNANNNSNLPATRRPPQRVWPQGGCSWKCATSPVAPAGLRRNADSCHAACPGTRLPENKAPFLPEANGLDTTSSWRSQLGVTLRNLHVGVSNFSVYFLLTSLFHHLSRFIVVGFASYYLAKS